MERGEIGTNSGLPAGTQAPVRSRVAVIDLGTNSTRLLVADVSDGEVSEVERRTRVTRLGRGVDLAGRLSDDGIEAVCEAVGEYIGLARPLAPERTVAIATSAVRDAENGQAFLAELRERFALDPRVIDGETEGRLTYRGVTAGRETDAECRLICDIGGGSTELVTGCGPEVQFFRSLQIGVVRQTERHVSEDPPVASALEELAEEVRTTIVDAIASASPPSPDEGIAVAGTPTTLAAIDLELGTYDSARVHGHRLSMERIQHLLSQLAALPLAKRREVTGIDPERAPTIVAGIVILMQAMRAFELSEIEVSEHDILHGAALEAAESQLAGNR